MKLSILGWRLLRHLYRCGTALSLISDEFLTLTGWYAGYAIRPRWITRSPTHLQMLSSHSHFPHLHTILLAGASKPLMLPRFILVDLWAHIVVQGYGFARSPTLHDILIIVVDDCGHLLNQGLADLSLLFPARAALLWSISHYRDKVKLF